MVPITPNNLFLNGGKNIKSRINTWIGITRNQYLAIAIILLVSFLIRMYLTPLQGFGYDIALFKDWSRGVYLEGFSNFYSSLKSDYPPFYIYFLWAVGAFYKLFISSAFDTEAPVFITLLKVPAILTDISTALLIFLIVRKYSSFKLAFISMVSYAFNPAIIFDSAIWGQVDSVYTLFFMLALMFFVLDRSMLSGISLAIAILTKPQSLVLVPFFALLMIKKYSPLTVIKVSIASFAAFVIVALPFYLNTSILDLFRLYHSSYEQYPYNSLNAYNLWALTTGLFKQDSTEFWSMTYRMWGYLLFGLVFIYIAYFILKSKDNKSIYISVALLFFAFFMLFTRIHERYLFPIFAPLAVAMTFYRRLSYVYVLATFTFLFNMYMVLEENKTGVVYPNADFLVPLISGINLVLFIITIYLFSISRKNYSS